jgi:phage baseplate assembly protein V
MQRMLQPIMNKLRLLVSRGVVRVIDDAKKMQSLQVELHEGELHDQVERFQDFGFTSVPKPEAEAIYLSVGGNRAAGVVVAVSDRQYRPTGMAEGDVCLYTESGERVYLNEADDVVHLGAKSAADWVALAADTKAEISALRDTVDSLITAYNAHIHVTTATVSAGPPGVLQPPASAASPPAAVGDVAATKVKAT